MYETGLMAAGGGLGAAGGAGLGELGRSKLLDLLAPLDYPRQALWNLVRGGGRMLSGEGDIGDLLGAIPGALGAGATALGGPLAGAAVGGLAQGLGRATGSSMFDAATPADLVEQMGGDRDSLMQTLLTGIATDPLTYLGGFGGARGGRAMAPSGGVGGAGVAAEMPAATGGSLFSAIPDSGNPLQGAGYASSAPRTMSQQEYFRWLATPEAEARDLAGAVNWAKPAGIPDDDVAMSIFRQLEQEAAENAGKQPWWAGVGDNPTPAFDDILPAPQIADYSGFLDEIKQLERQIMLGRAARERWASQIYDIDRAAASSAGGALSPLQASMRASANAKDAAALRAHFINQQKLDQMLREIRWFGNDVPGGRKFLDLNPEVAMSINDDLATRFGILGDYAADGRFGDLPNQSRFRPTFYSMLGDALAANQAGTAIAGMGRGSQQGLHYGMREAANALPSVFSGYTPGMHLRAVLLSRPDLLPAAEFGQLAPRSFGDRATIAQLADQMMAAGLR